MADNFAEQIRMPRFKAVNPPGTVDEFADNRSQLSLAEDSEQDGDIENLDEIISLIYSTPCTISLVVRFTWAILRSETNCFIG